MLQWLSKNCPNDLISFNIMSIMLPLSQKYFLAKKPIIFGILILVGFSPGLRSNNYGSDIFPIDANNFWSSVNGSDSRLKGLWFDSREWTNFCSHHMLDHRSRKTSEQRATTVSWFMHSIACPLALNRLQKVWWSDVKQTQICF